MTIQGVPEKMSLSEIGTLLTKGHFLWDTQLLTIKDSQQSGGVDRIVVFFMNMTINQLSRVSIKKQNL